MRVAVVTGIFPPDIGGPASHAADVVRELEGRGHDVRVITLHDEKASLLLADLVRFPRGLPWIARLLLVARQVWRWRGLIDVVYATGMHTEAVVGGRISRRPVVLKIVSDPAWERSRRLGLTNEDLDTFQTPADRSWRVRWMCDVRTWTARHATDITVPSKQLSGIVSAWHPDIHSPRVIRNGANVSGPVSTRRLQGRLQAIFVGRLIPLKRVDLLLDALSLVEDAVDLEVVGDGEERDALERRAAERGLLARVRFTGALPRRDTMERLAVADVLMLASEHEGLPFVAVEALASGVPIVGPAVGGLPEVVMHEVNGLLVAPEAQAFAAALSRLLNEPELLPSLSDQAAADSARWRLGDSIDALERMLSDVSLRKPRAVFIGKTNYSEVTPDIQHKMQIIAVQLDAKIVAVGPPGRSTVGGIPIVCFPAARPALLGGLLFYLIAPVVSLVLAVSHGGGVIVCQSPYEALGIHVLTRFLPRKFRPLVVVEVHGDWRTATRFYGSRVRRIFAPLADRVARWSLVNADLVRVIGTYTETLVREAGYGGPTISYITFSDFALFTDEPIAPIPKDPEVLYIGALEPTKGVDVLIQAWTQVAEEVPDARLLIVGRGSQHRALEALVRRTSLQNRITFLGSKSRGDIRPLIDKCSLVVVPSRSEGLGRVILEAYARGRPVVASKVGGIPSIVIDGQTGVLVPPDSANDLAGALITLLADPERMRSLGEGAANWFVQNNPTTSFERGINDLAQWVTTNPG